MTIEEMRIRLGMTRKTLSKRIHASEQDLKDWELGKKEPPEYVTELIENMVQMQESGETAEEVLSKNLERRKRSSPGLEEAGRKAEKPKTLKKLRKKAGMTRRIMSLRYNIPEQKIADWESGREPAPLNIAEMLKKAADNHVPRTQEEIMRLPFTVIDLKLMCDYMIREGYGERSVLLSNDTNESGYHGMYYGFGPEDESYTFITLN